MKRLHYLFFVFFLLTNALTAQSPKGFQYQAVARNADGALLTGQTVDLRLSLLQNDETGPVSYAETHQVQTSDYGLFTLTVGAGDPVSGAFAGIDWQAGPYFLRVEIDLTGNGNYQSLGTQRLWSVPYALHAATVDNADDADADPTNELQELSYDPATNTLQLSNGSAVSLSDLDDGDGTDDQQLSLNGTLLTIENGNTVDLETVQDGTQDADADPTNELQYLSIEDNQLVIGPEGSSVVTLPAGGDSYWLPAGSAIFYDEGDVFVDNTLIVGQDVLVANLSDPDGLTGVELITYTDGEGRVLTYGANGNPNAALLSTDEFNDGGLSLYDEDGNEQLAAGISSVNAGVMELYGPNGNSNVALSSAASNTNHGWLGLQDFDGYTQVLLTILDDTGEGYVETVGPNGQPNVQLTSAAGNSNHGYIAVNESGGFEAASLSVLSSGEGLVAAVGANGNDNVQLSSVAGNPNRGYLAVMDEFGDIRAGTYIDNFGDGIVFGDLKNFRMDHPAEADKEIWYASVEGPEAAAYVRGTAQLEQGEAFVPFPEHFVQVANPETMTVMLTPLSADTRGLAVIEKSDNGFRVKELMGGTGSFGFDWEVKCVRKGYEDYRVVRDKSEARPASDGRTRHQQASKREDYIRMQKRPAKRGE